MGKFIALKHQLLVIIGMGLKILDLTQEATNWFILLTKTYINNYNIKIHNKARTNIENQAKKKSLSSNLSGF